MISEYRTLDTLKGWDKNPRGIKPKDFDRLKRQIQKHGQFKPVIITKDNEVIGGNMRLKAYKELGIDNVWVSIVDPKTEAEKVGIALADNDRAGYYLEDELHDLVATLEDIDLEDYHIDLGSTLSLKDFEDKHTEVEEDEFDVEEVLPADGEEKTKLGDIYQLGNHRLMCGDSTESSNIGKLMDQKEAEMLFTDPPYFIGLSSTGTAISEADKANMQHFFSGWMRHIPMYARDHWYICTDWRTYPVVSEVAYKHIGKIHNLIVWDFEWIKAGTQYRFTHELIIFGDRKGKRQVPRTESDVWRVKAENFTKERMHGAQKPIDLCAKAVRNSSDEGQIVLDLFGGSGSTLIACEQLGRTCYMMELDPKYVDVIVKRWEQFTGSKAELLTKNEQ